MTTTTNAVAGPGPNTLCIVCQNNAALYTCPRCSAKTCSATCVSQHKKASGCSGERDKAAFVPMNQYNYETLMNDYVFLEDVGRKADQWGREIMKAKLLNSQRLPVTARGMRGRGGRGGGRAAITRNGDKRYYLTMQLALRDVNMDVLPAGMEKCKRNHSRWDSKKKTAMLTVEFVYRPPPHLLPKGQESHQTISIISHKNDWNLTLEGLVKNNVLSTPRLRKDEKIYDWLNSLLGLGEEEEVSAPLCVMQRSKLDNENIDLIEKGRYYYRMDWRQKLSSLLKHKHFVEFPTIEIMEERDFRDILINDEGILQDNTFDHGPKRRKLDAVTAKKVISGLVGGYGSEEEGMEDETPRPFAKVEEYDASDRDEDEDDENSEEGGNENEDVADVELNQEDYKEILGQIQAQDALISVDEINEDVVDWEDSDEEILADEAKLAELVKSLRKKSGTS